MQRAYKNYEADHENLEDEVTRLGMMLAKLNAIESAKKINIDRDLMILRERETSTIVERGTQMHGDMFCIFCNVKSRCIFYIPCYHCLFCWRCFLSQWGMGDR